MQDGSAHPRPDDSAFTYDELNRLTQDVVTDPDHAQAALYHYGYDGVSNMTDLEGATLSYNAANELTSVQGKGGDRQVNAP